ncbi:MAG: RNA-binding S4 domain-containing protein, partial [Candidatus Woesearchaeota archaeon]
MVEKYIPLNAFLKIKGVVDTGGQAKIVIRSGEVYVNSEKETRVTKKLKPNDV